MSASLRVWMPYVPEITFGSPVARASRRRKGAESRIADSEDNGDYVDVLQDCVPFPSADSQGRGRSLPEAAFDLQDRLNDYKADPLVRPLPIGEKT
jgi:hypothetical protein